MFIIRSLFKPKHYRAERRHCPLMDKYTKYALYVAIFCSVWLSFKYVEPIVFPVIKDFKVLSVEKYKTNSILISGELNKVRSCELVEILGYSGKKFIKVEYLNFDKKPAYNRLAREQTYGPWILTPKVNQIELYSKHLCLTGAVITKLFNGVVAL